MFFAKLDKDVLMLKIAIVHEWFVSYAGSEKVLEQILNIFPESDLFAVVDFLDQEQRGFIHNKSVKTTFIQKLPFARKKFRSYLPLMPLAVEQLDLSRYDIVISNSHAVAKGVITGPDQLHICMCHSPIRYGWDLQHQYLEESRMVKGVKSYLARWMLHKIRNWDYRTANGVDFFVANSHFIKRRISKVYRREAKVIYPPVSVDDFTLNESKEDFFITASRMVPYKKIDLIVEAFSQMPEKRLIVIGDGPEYSKIREKATPNITLLGYQKFEVLRDYMQRAKAFVFAAEEDFGIVPLEAQACGTPVIAFGKGGALETVIDRSNSKTPTGLFFQEQTVKSIQEAVGIFEQEISLFVPTHCRDNALRFSQERFRKEFKSFITEKYEDFIVEKTRK